MSKELTSICSNPTIDATSRRSEIVDSLDISQLEGKLKTLIDSMGFPEKQEKAFKDTVNIIIWDWFKYITDYQTDHLFDKKKGYEAKNKK